MKSIAIFFLKFVPAFIIKIVVKRGVYSIKKKHPDVMERLSTTYGKTVYAFFTDLNYGVLTKISENKTIVEKYKAREIKADLLLKGNFFDLISIIEGKMDGDALFFSRKIEVEGDTEMLITIRNAFDSADIKLFKEFIFSIF